MKKLIFSFFAVFLISGCTPPKEEIDVAKEEEAIEATINKEIELWAARDYILEADYVKKAEDVRTIVNNGNFHNVTVGWDSIFAGLKRFSELDGWQYVTNLKIENKDFNIKVYYKVAWAVYYVQRSWEYKGEPWDDNTSRITFLEKVDDNWKIVLMTSTTLNPCKDENNEGEEEGIEDE